ncbi:MAG: DUF6622 family protein [Mesorhizobium sp.]
MRTIYEIIAHTPIWVWAVFALIVGLGLSKTRDRTTSIAGLLVLPAVMALYSLSGIVHASLGVLPATIVGVAIGGVGGWLMEREGATRRMPDGRIWVRGEWTSLVLVLAIFSFRYTAGVLSATSPEIANGTSWQILTALASGFFAALFIARTTARLNTWATEGRSVSEKTA